MKYKSLILLCTLGCFATAKQSSVSVSVPSFSPFYFDSFSPGQACRGVAVDVLNLLSEAAGIEFEVQSYPYARILKSLSEGSLSAALIFKNERLASDVYYVGPVALSKVIIVARGNR